MARPSHLLCTQQPNWWGVHLMNAAIIQLCLFSCLLPPSPMSKYSPQHSILELSHMFFPQCERPSSPTYRKQHDKVIVRYRKAFHTQADSFFFCKPYVFHTWNVSIKWRLMVLWTVLLYMKVIFDSWSAGRLGIWARIFLFTRGLLRAGLKASCGPLSSNVKEAPSPVLNFRCNSFFILVEGYGLNHKLRISCWNNFHYLQIHLILFSEAPWLRPCPLVGNARMVPQIRPPLLPSISFATHHLIILSYRAFLCDLCSTVE